MSISLAIDTSTSRTSVAIIDEGGLLWHGYRDGATSHGDALPALVLEGLMTQPVVEQVVVGMGPGPFTGLRVGIAFARTFALARTIPIIGICSLDAIAACVRERDDFIVATDARRKEIYWTRYQSGMRVEGPSVDLPALVATKGIPMFGEGAVKYSIAASDEDQYPDLLALVDLSKNSDMRIDEPLYIRHPDAVPTSERNK
ncbi:MAG TPA: tRNA (adenosine(37)-N6)-threonylcarbamoyltransferase complex dimerization subunit type 1 TsaB [Candidatus Paceibacterota bacterium]|nr:tRNA (adenosine(37)-N6)-threonylcarbamoyltransferase complex dimerization subunit type 1 TsaB [Candidatus Paceibacterota bacterium]